MKRSLFAVCLVAALGFASPALAQGLWPGLPAIGTISGTECIPLDTGLSGGRAPQTACITPNKLNGYATSTVTLTDATTVSWDMSLSNAFTVTKVATGWIGTPTGMKNGQSYSLRIVVGATGLGTGFITWPSVIKWASGTAPTMTNTSGRADQFRFLYDGGVFYGEIIGQNYTP